MRFCVMILSFSCVESTRLRLRVNSQMGHRATPPTASAAGTLSSGPSVESASDEELRNVYRAEKAKAEATRERLAEAARERSPFGSILAAAQESARAAIGPSLNALAVRLLKPRLQPHDIPVITLEGSVTPEAVDALLSHRACAVHVRRFLDESACSDLSGALADAVFTNWQINRR